MPTMTFTRQGSGGGMSFNQTKNLSVSRFNVSQLPVTAAKTGNLTTRTSDTVGELTMTAGHGIITANRLDLYWSDAGQMKVRYGVVVGTVAVNQVPISGGSGDILPADESAITAKVPQTIDIDLLGDDIAGFLASAGAAPAAVFAFVSGAEAALAEVIITEVGAVGMWYPEMDRYGQTNRFAGDTIAKCYVSHSDSAASRDMKLAIGLT